jgi:hypothetical protein
MEENFVADALSRQCWGQYGADSGRIDCNEHMLATGWFLELQQRYGSAFTIDACAHARNRRVHRYVVRYDTADADCIVVNVLAYTFPPQGGSRKVVYRNPPWVLIAPLWRHFRLCRLRGVMIVPEFPREQWYGMVQSEAVAVWLLASKGELDVFRQPLLDYKASLGPLPWNLLACEFDFI